MQDKDNACHSWTFLEPIEYEAARLGVTNQVIPKLSVANFSSATYTGPYELLLATVEQGLSKEVRGHVTGPIIIKHFKVAIECPSFFAK